MRLEAAEVSDSGMGGVPVRSSEVSRSLCTSRVGALSRGKRFSDNNPLARRDPVPRTAEGFGRLTRLQVETK